MNNQMAEDKIFKDEVSLVNYIKILLKRKIVVIVPFILSIMLTSVIYTKSPVTFKKYAIIKIGSFSKLLFSFNAASWAIRDQRTLIDAIDKYKLDTDINSLKEMFDSGEIKITSLDPQFLKITVETSSSERSKSICFALANTFIERGNILFLKKKQYLESQLKDYQDSKNLRNNTFIYQASLNNQLLINEELLNAEEFEITVFPSSLANQEKSKKKVDMRIPASGLLFGVVLAFFLEFWANNLKKHD